MRILSIDAWRDPDGGWTWNQWFDTSETVEESEVDTNRKAIAKLRELGLLGQESAGRLAVEDDGYNIVIMARGTREPLLAIEYGLERFE